MTDEQIALARRAVACKGWRWLPGMLRDDGYRHICYGVWARWGANTDVINIITMHLPDQYPDLTDHATLGCLLALVREARGRLCYTQPCGGYWTVQREDTDEGWGDHCVTEAEALVAALEAAPCGQ